MDYETVRRLGSVWQRMLTRCENPRSKDYANYGGRGITVCTEWHDFNIFCHWAVSSDYSPRLQLDRIDNDGDYEPGNCRWATRLVQANNKRNNVWVEAFGENKTLAEWSRDERCAVSRWALGQRLRAGWPPERALLTPSTFSSEKCINGHERTEENTGWQLGPGGRWQRYCRRCHADRQNKRYLEGKASHSPEWRKAQRKAKGSYD